MHPITAMFALAIYIIWVGQAAASGGGLPIRTQLVVDGLTFPTAVTFAPGDSTHLYILEKPGRVRATKATPVRTSDHFRSAAESPLRAG